MSNTIQGSQDSLLKLQGNVRILDDTVIQHETIIPGLREGVESSWWKADSALAKVNKRMEEFQDWLNHIRPTDMNTDIPMVIVNSLNEVIQDNSPSATVEIVCQQVEELAQGVLFNRQAADHMSSVVMEIQEKLNVTTPMNTSLRT